MSKPSERFENSTSIWLKRALIASVLLGIALRFLWTHDMEYKGDEQYMFERTQAVGVSEGWPMLGMPSGAGPRNPGMSIWIFVVLAKLFQITTPIGLVHAVIAMNCLALIALGYFALRSVPSEDREGWTWATILASVSPIGIQLQRKIWAQSVLPLFCVGFLASWMKRDRPIGAFFWGLIGAILGQIHMSGFFFAAAFVVWSFFKKAANTKPTRWGYWFVGSVLGALPLLPWVYYLLTAHEETRHARLIDLMHLTYWVQWIGQSFGIGLSESLGFATFRHFLRWPYLGSLPTFGIGLMHAASLICGTVILYQGIQFLRTNRSDLRNRLLGMDSDSQKAQNAAFFGTGGGMLLGRIGVYRHYLIVTFPLMHLWLSRMALSRPRVGRRLLIVMAVAQLLISFGFLAYIHQYGGSPNGDYGVAYSAQTPSR